MKSTKRTEEEGRRWQPGRILADEASGVHIRNGAFGKTLLCHVSVVLIAIVDFVVIVRAGLWRLYCCYISGEFSA